jgi:hypothetical protein
MELVSTPQRNKIHPHKFILWVALASIVMMFAGLTSAYVVKSSQAGWESVQLPNLFWVSTIIILLSSLTIQMICSDPVAGFSMALEPWRSTERFRRRSIFIYNCRFARRTRFWRNRCPILPAW